MTATTEHVLNFLKDKSPGEIEKTLRNLERMSTAQAEESGAIAARQAAADDKMSLNDVEIKLQKAIATNDQEALKRWQPLHKQKLQWVSDQVRADEQARVDKTNKPAVEARQARRTELLNELNILTRGTVSGNFDRIASVQDELRALS
jgi:hypothetical protein